MGCKNVVQGGERINRCMCGAVYGDIDALQWASKSFLSAKRCSTCGRQIRCAVRKGSVVPIRVISVQEFARLCGGCPAFNIQEPYMMNGNLRITREFIELCGAACLGLEPWEVRIIPSPQRKDVRCPACGFIPTEAGQWGCACGHYWDTFKTGGVCPACHTGWEKTICPDCKVLSPHRAWYAPTSP